MKRFCSLFILICVFSAVYGQEEETQSAVYGQEKEPRSGAGRFFFGKRGDSYTYIGIGFGNYALKDQNQSPLTYRSSGGSAFGQSGLSVPLYFALGHLKRREGRERTITVNVMNKNVLVNDFDVTRSMELDIATFFSYNMLYTLNPLSTERFNLKVGGDLNVYASIFRIDQGLGNFAAVPFEIFASLNPVIKLSYDLSRKEAKESRFLFFRPKVRPKRERSVSLTLKIPGTTINNRPDNYAFATQNIDFSSEDNADNRGFGFGGMVFGTETFLEWKLLDNKNRMRAGFTWDFITQEKFNKRFYSSRLLIGATFLFSTKSIKK